jgi:hypothetical protein
LMVCVKYAKTLARASGSCCRERVVRMCFPGLKGQNNIAQGNALGIGESRS